MIQRIYKDEDDEEIIQKKERVVNQMVVKGNALMEVPIELCGM